MLHTLPSITKLNALIGTLIHTPTFGKLNIINRGALIYNSNGIITDIMEQDNHGEDLGAILSADPKIEMLIDYGNKMITPGLIDAHCHAPQYVFTGMYQNAIF